MNTKAFTRIEVIGNFSKRGEKYIFSIRENGTIKAFSMTPYIWNKCENNEYSCVEFTKTSTDEIVKAFDPSNIIIENYTVSNVITTK